MSVITELHNGPRFVVRLVSAEQGQFLEVVDKPRNKSREYTADDLGGLQWRLLTVVLATYAPEDREILAGIYRQRGGVYRPTGPGWSRAVADRMVRLSDALDGIDSESDRAKAICAAGRRLFDFSA